MPHGISRNRRRKRLLARGGFTLIELMVVVVILGTAVALIPITPVDDHLG